MTDQHVFSIAPLEMARDHRLTAAQYRVLLALLSFRNREGNLVWPSRERLAELTGYTINSISKYTRQLEDLGWVTKSGKGGRGRAVRYQITVPDLGCDPGETVTEQVTVSRLDHPVENRGTSRETPSNPETVSSMETVSNPDTKTGKTLSNPDTKTLSNLDRGIEQTKEQTKIGNRPEGTRARARATRGTSGHSRSREQETRAGSQQPLSPPPWINQDAWAEFEQHRREIRKPLTDLARKKAWNQLRGLDHAQQQQVIDYSIAGRYTGLFPDRLKAVKPKRDELGVNRQIALEERNRRATEGWVPPEMRAARNTGGR